MNIDVSSLTSPDEKLHRFLKDVSVTTQVDGLKEAATLIVFDDKWNEVSGRISIFQELSGEFKKKAWDFKVIKNIARSSQLLKGSVSIAIHVNDYFNHKDSEKHLKELVGGDSSPTAGHIDEWINTACELGFHNPSGKPTKADAALFASALLGARYPNEFADFRQKRWKSIAEYLGLEVPHGSYGERLLQVGELVREVAATSTFQTYFLDKNTNAIVGGLAYLIHNKDRWLGEMSSGFQEIQEIKGKPSMTNHYPLNMILYGPPGTGKTYQTANLAVGICNSEEPSSRAEVKEAYDKLVAEKRIQFVSFHQSYSYEDFLEGIRPVLNGEESGSQGVAYEIKDGVFKEICALAKKTKITPIENGGGLDSLEGRRFHKMSVGGIYDPNVESYCFENDCVALGWGGDIDYSILDKGADWASSREAIESLMEKSNFKLDSSYHLQALYWFKDYMHVGDLIIVPRGLKKVIAIGVIEGEYEYRPDIFPGYNHFRKVRWLVKDVDIPVGKVQTKQFSQQTIYTMDDKAMHMDFLESLLVKQQYDSKESENYVLIIDEINRANISKVLGELITLIEPDKRLDGENAISLQLPYSGDEFGVPNNLYIIGTMNTADRSIALMDTALRRRFVFQEIIPDPSLLDGQKIDGIDLGKLLRSINNRIEYYYDRDHTIGHAFLMNLNNFDDLRNVILQKLIPLLQEYFYEDWEKVRHVLGGGTAQIIQREKLVPPDNESFDDRYRYFINNSLGVEEVRAVYATANSDDNEDE